MKDDDLEAVAICVGLGLVAFVIYDVVQKLTPDPNGPASEGFASLAQAWKIICADIAGLAAVPDQITAGVNSLTGNAPASGPAAPSEISTTDTSDFGVTGGNW